MTVGEAVSEVTQLRGDINETLAYAFMKKFHRWLCDHYILKTELFRVAVTDGVASYALDESIRRVRTVTYIQNANSYVALLPESTKDWDIVDPAWRQLGKATPQAFSAEEGFLTIKQTPNETSVGSGANMYPRLDVWAAVTPPFAKTDTLPADVYVDVYTTGTILKWAEHNCPEQVQLLTYQLANQLATLEYMLVKVNHNFRPRQTPAEMYQRPM